MKKILFIALFGLTAMLGYSQNIVLVNPTTEAGGDVDSIVYIKLHILNNSGTQQTLTTKRVENNLAPDHKSYFCVGIICYGPGTSIAQDPIIIEPSMEDTSFKGYLNAYGSPGTSVVKYCFVNGDATDSTCITFTYNMGTTGIINNSHNVFIKAFPNPSSTEFSVLYNSEVSYSDLKLVLYDINGRKINEVSQGSTEGLMTMSTQNIANGLYVVSLVADGTVIANERLAVAH